MKPILFDFNGTLYNDTRFHILSWQKFLHQELNIDFTEERIMEVCIGPSNTAILKGLLGDISDARIEELAKTKEAYYRATCREKAENLRLINGAPEMLDALNAKNVPFALATSSGIDNVNFYLNDLGLNRWFDLNRIVYENGTVASKPDPAFYTEAAHRLNADPADCIVVEDSPTGLRGAMNAGVKTLIAMDRTMSKEVLTQFPEISAVIHDYHGFPELIEKL